MTPAAQNLLEVKDLTVSLPACGPRAPHRTGPQRLDVPGPRAAAGHRRRVGKRQVAHRARPDAATAPAGAASRRRVLLDGENLLTLSARDMARIRAQRMSMIHQDPMSSLNPVFTVGRQIVEAIRIGSDVSAAKARTRASTCSARSGVPDPSRRIDSYPHEFSGGMRQRVDDRDGAGRATPSHSSRTSPPPRSTSRPRPGGGPAVARHRRTRAGRHPHHA